MKMLSVTAAIILFLVCVAPIVWYWQTSEIVGNQLSPVSTDFSVEGQTTSQDGTEGESNAIDEALAEYKNIPRDIADLKNFIDQWPHSDTSGGSIDLKFINLRNAMRTLAITGVPEDNAYLLSLFLSETPSLFIPGLAYKETIEGFTGGEDRLYMEIRGEAACALAYCTEEDFLYVESAYNSVRSSGGELWSSALSGAIPEFEHWSASHPKVIELHWFGSLAEAMARREFIESNGPLAMLEKDVFGYYKDEFSKLLRKYLYN